MKKPSIFGEVAAVISVINFIYWVSSKTPKWILFLWIIFGLVFIIDWMLGGVSDKGICKKCF